MTQNHAVDQKHEKSVHYQEALELFKSSGAAQLLACDEERFDNEVYPMMRHEWVAAMVETRHWIPFAQVAEEVTHRMTVTALARCNGRAGLAMVMGK